MSDICTSASAPINIPTMTAAETHKICDLKCQYVCNYKITSSIITNKGTSIKLTYDNLNSPPVTYNGVKYSVDEIRIYSPSIHTWNKETTDAEMIIVHKPTDGTSTDDLSVSIPIKASSSTTPSSLSAIISQINSTSQQAGSTTQLSSLNLNDFVPIGVPFYSYNGSLIFDSCNGDDNSYVIFDPNITSGYKTIASGDLKTLQSIISASNIQVKANNSSINNKTTDIYYNKKGAQQGTTDSEIWIDCKPTGELGETLVKVPGSTLLTDFNDYIGKYLGDESFEDILESSVVQTFFAAIVFFIIWKIGTFLMNLLGSAASAIPERSGPKAGQQIEGTEADQIDDGDLI